MHMTNTDGHIPINPYRQIIALIDSINSFSLKFRQPDRRHMILKMETFQLICFSNKFKLAIDSTYVLLVNVRQNQQVSQTKHGLKSTRPATQLQNVQSVARLLVPSAT